MQYGCDFGLWPRQIVRELVARKFDIRLSLASVGALLARLGLTAQKPLQRADPRDPSPTLATQANRDGAAISGWDESGVCADSVQGKPGH
jgi:transposase